jgi:hypothetical protein
MGFGNIKSAITGTYSSCDPQQALSCSLRMALQPPLQAQKKRRAPRPRRCSDRAHTLPINSRSQIKSGDVEVIRIPFGIAAFLAQIRLKPGVRLVTLPLNAGSAAICEFIRNAFRSASGAEGLAPRIKATISRWLFSPRHRLGWLRRRFTSNRRCRFSPSRVARPLNCPRGRSSPRSVLSG